MSKRDKYKIFLILKLIHQRALLKYIRNWVIQKISIKIIYNKLLLMHYIK
jgi:hypothetical protein